MPVPPAIRREVERRARGLCEYCHAPQSICGYRFHVEHVLPRAVGGSDDLSNLALSCAPCNLAKGPRTQAADSITGEVVALFDPRRQPWDEHFTWSDDFRSLVGTTATGRATVIALSFNAQLRQDVRGDWHVLGLLP